jgi:hypothetical protein
MPDFADMPITIVSACLIWTEGEDLRLSSLSGILFKQVYGIPTKFKGILNVA